MRPLTRPRWLSNTQGFVASLLWLILAKRVNIWEYEKHVTVKPDTGNPNEWDWTPAFAQAGMLGKRLILTDGTFRMRETAIAPGTQIEGEGSGRFSGVRTILQSINPFEKLLKTLTSSSPSQRDAFSLTGVRLVSDFGLTIGDPTVLIVDDGPSPYEMRPYISECSMFPITAGAGYGCLFAKAFDHILEKCDVTGFARCIVELGSDIGSIRFNRVISFSEYGILQLSAKTFGSQTEIFKNDILSGGVGSTYIKTTARHVRVVDDYLERAGSSQIKGFIDLTTLNAPSYGPNSAPNEPYFSAFVDLNRIDGQQNSTDFVYRYEPVGYNATIRDVGTPGVRSVNSWLTVVGDAVPLFSTVNTGNANMLRHEFIGSGERRWANFRPESLRSADGWVSFNHLSIASLDIAELRRNNAHMHVRLTDHSILLKSSLSSTIFHCILPKVTLNGVDVNNVWLRAGVSYTVTVTARMISGTGTLRFLKIVDGASQGPAVDTVLTTQSQKIVTTMTGAGEASKVGIAFSNSASNTTDVEVLSVTFKEA